MIDNLSMVKALGRLLAVCQESKQRYQAAANTVKNGELREWFATCATQQARFIAALRAEVCFHGGNPQPQESAALVAYRDQVDFDAVLNTGDEHAILTACKSGEDVTLSTYAEVRQVHMIPEILTMVTRQHSAIQEAYERLTLLEEQTRTVHRRHRPDHNTVTGLYSLYLDGE